MEVALAPSSSKPDKGVKSVGPSRKRRTLCFASIAIFIGIVLLCVILAFTVFKAKHPVTTIDSVSLHDVNFSLDIPRLKVYLNLSLDVSLSIKNPNKVGFKYTNGSALLKYRGEVVGEVPILAGKISAGEKKAMNVTVTLLADRLLSNSNVYSDVISGTLPLTTYAKISGKVLILFKIHVVSETTCDLTINVLNRTVGNQSCKYKTKL